MNFFLPGAFFTIYVFGTVNVEDLFLDNYDNASLPVIFVPLHRLALQLCSGNKNTEKYR